MAVPDVLTAYAAFKPNDLGEVLRRHLQHSDIRSRATAAQLLAELPSIRKMSSHQTRFRSGVGNG